MVGARILSPYKSLVLGGADLMMGKSLLSSGKEPLLVSRRNFIKYGAATSAVSALPFSLAFFPSEVTANGFTYNLALNSGENLLLNGSGVLILSQVFPGPFDSDGDGLNDQQETLLGTDPFISDTDGDTLSDGYEVGYDGDASNYSVLTDLNPLAVDTDGDGFNDNIEINSSSDPINPSSFPSIAAPLLTPVGNFLLGATFILTMGYFGRQRNKEKIDNVS